MSKSVSAKQTILVVGILAAIGAGAGFVYPMMNAEKAAPTIPDGYNKVNSSETSTEIVHEFVKPAPKKEEAVQTAEQSFERYQNALPEDEKIVGNEYKSLYKSRQNAQLYADYTALMARAKENTSRIKELDEGSKTKSADSANGNYEFESISEEASVGSFVSDDSEQPINSSEVLPIDTVKLKGIYTRKKSGVEQHVALVNINNSTRRVVTGDELNANIKVVAVNANKLIVSHSGENRSFRLEGGF